MDGLRLIEVAEGVDIAADVLDRLPFSVDVAPELADRISGEGTGSNAANAFRYGAQRGQ
jgi:hypothetical protein